MAKRLAQGAALAGLALSGAMPGGAASEEAAGAISCRNEAAEISCTKEGCEVRSEGFEPMRLDLTPERGRLCWSQACLSGVVVSRYDGKSYAFYDLALAAVDGGEAQGGAAQGGGAERARPETIRVGVIHRPASDSALVSWGEFAQVMTCSRGS